MPIRAAQDQSVELDESLEFSDDPRFLAALEDAEARHRLLVDLVKQRKAMGMTQTAVAKHMETSQSFVSEFENGATDPHLSTLQRYARAVTARLVVRVELPAEHPWQTDSRWSRATQLGRYGGRTQHLRQPEASAGMPPGPMMERWLANVSTDGAVQAGLVCA